jgi:two-component system sensor kinase FixL
VHWVITVWSSVAAGCLILALQHLAVWFYRRQAWEHLFFAGTAVSVATVAGGELYMMYVRDPWLYGEIMRWMHVPIFTGVGCIVGFVWFYFRTGTAWLALVAMGLRVVSLGLNFLADVNLNYARILELKHIQLLGEPVTVAIVEPNPWRKLGEFTGLLFVLFVADASLRLWRRGNAIERRRAALIGGAITLFLIIGFGQSILIHSGHWHSPYFISLAFSFLIFFMALELSRDVLRAARLTGELQVNEAALRESEQRMDLAASAAGLGLWNWEIRENRIWLTNRARELHGAPGQEFITFEQFLETILPEDRPALEERIAAALREGHQFHAEYRLRPGPGAGRAPWVAARGGVEYDEAGAPLRLRGVTVEISERKYAEEEARQRQTEVTHLSRVTTLGGITGSLAHELNQPLGAILANAEAAELHLRRENPDLDEVRNILADIRKDDLRAGEIIHGMRAFLRRQGLVKEPLAVGDLLRDTAKLVSADATARQATVSLQITGDLPDIHADRVHLQQVLVNLMVNGLDAMSATPRDQRRLVLAAAPGPGGLVEITVSDAGAGIPPAQLALLFQPFHTTKRGGLGLGLAICQSIVQAHGGRIVLENNAESGATARVTLPA